MSDWKKKPGKDTRGNGGAENALNPAVEEGLAGAIGLGFAFILLKLGHAVVIPSLFDTPGDLFEALTQPWPVTWGMALLVLLVLAGFLSMHWQRPFPAWAFWLPLIWLGWQFLASWRSVDADLTGKTLRHFTAAIASFYLGWLVLGRLSRQRLFWWGLLAGFLVILVLGFRQHYGEMEATRQFVEEQERAGWRNLPLEEQQRFVKQGVLQVTPDGLRANPEFLKRVRGGRIFATFGGYPNALAGAILLLLPVMLVIVWRASADWPPLGRKVVVGLLAYMAVACLYWSGSKAGWLVALGMLGLAGWQLPVPKGWKVGISAVLVMGGLAGFFWKYGDYFQRGATSVGARVEAWQVALQTGADHPLLGTGPGTFGKVYLQKKRPEAEMAHLAHNDYLEQLSDSGLVGFIAYLMLLPGSLWFLYRRSCLNCDWPTFAVWLGLTGWAVQGFVEFTLYVPSLAWSAFLLLGWLWAGHGTRIEFDKANVGR